MLHRRLGPGTMWRQRRQDRAIVECAHGHQTLHGARNPLQTHRDQVLGRVSESRNVLAGSHLLGAAAALSVRRRSDPYRIHVRVQAALLRVHHGRSRRDGHETGGLRAEAQAAL